MTPPPSSTYARLRALFEQCADMAPGERAEWLDRHATDTGLRIELELMLAADAHHAPLLRHDPAELVDRLEAVGTAGHADGDDLPCLVGRRYGAFQLIELIGRGGQGVVYRAERVEGDFAQTVAVKLLNQGIHDPQQHRRFRREREILARLDHPGVARLIDGGVSDEGVPYLIMDFVDGESIDQWCAHQDLGRDARLALFERLCTIVAAAHRALIVHRDLKPSNVLVTRAGEVKVLDFGIAHLLDDEHAQVGTLVPMMTPGYCAPEQIDGRPITLATDVHALGVLLRQLVTGEPPRVASAPPTSNASDLGLREGALAPELGWIAAKATASEPERRYRDALELGDDVARFRSARPVLAHPPSTLYSVRKFVRRHRGGVIVTLALVLGVLASAGVALWQAHVAREHARRAEATRDFLLGVFQSAQEELPADTRPTSDQLVAAAARKLELDTKLPAAEHAEFLTALGHVARYSNDPAAALPLFDRALEVSAAQGDGRDRLYTEVARAWSLLELGRPADAEHSLAPRLDALRATFDSLAVDGLWAYANALGETGRLDDSLRLLGEVRALSQRVYPADAIENLRISGAYSLALSDLGRLRESADVLDAMLTTWRDAGVPQGADYAIGLANLGMLKRRLGDLDEAETLFDQSLALHRRVHGQDHPDIAGLMQPQGLLLAERGKIAQAEPVLQHARAALVRAFGADHPQSIGAASALGVLDIERQRYTDAQVYLREAERACRESDGERSSSRCITNRQRIADVLRKLGHLDEAEQAARASLENRRALAGADSTDNAIPLRALGDVEFALDHAPAALAAYDEAAALYTRIGIDASLETAAVDAGRARALLALGRIDEAGIAIDRADAVTARIAPANAGRRLRVLTTRAQVLAASGRVDDARAVARSALALEPARAMLDAGEWETLERLAR
jgi:serine/threonine protein kinase/uncharacterized protein HemY